MHTGIDPLLLPPDRRYALMIGSIVPRPIAVVLSIRPRALQFQDICILVHSLAST
jgi:hypothetical protein